MAVISEKGSAQALSPEEFALLTARPETRIFTLCIAAAITGVILGFRGQWDSSAFLLIAGAVVSIIGTILFAGSLGSVHRSAMKALSGFAGILPYFFGLYLVFFRGFWNARELLDSPSLGRMIASIAFVYLGYRVVYWTWRLSEIGERVRKGDVVVGSSTP